MKYIINNLKNSVTWKIQLTIEIIYIFLLKCTDEECLMHSKSDDIEIMIKDKADKLMQEHFKSLLSRYKTDLEELMQGSNFIKCHEINLSRGRSFIDSPNSIKTKRDKKSFQ